MPASWCCATAPMVEVLDVGRQDPHRPQRHAPRPAQPGPRPVPVSRAANRATAMPITSSIGRTAGRPACRTWFLRADSTTARSTKGAFGWFRQTRKGSSGSCARTARRCRQEPPVASWEGAPLAPTDARLAAAGVSIGPHTATPEWYGESLEPDGGAGRAVGADGGRRARQFLTAASARGNGGRPGDATETPAALAVPAAATGSPVAGNLPGGHDPVAEARFLQAPVGAPHEQRQQTRKRLTREIGWTTGGMGLAATQVQQGDN